MGDTIRAEMRTNISKKLSQKLSLPSSHSLSFLNDNDNDHLFSPVSLSVFTALPYFVCQSACALARSLIGELLAQCRNKLSSCTCSDLLPLERSGPVPALEMEMCLWCACGVACLLLSGGLSSMRCLLYLDIHTSRGGIIRLPSSGSWLLLPFVRACLNFSPR